MGAKQKDLASACGVSETANVASPVTASVAFSRWFQGQPFRAVPWRNLRNSYVTMMHASGYDLDLIAKLCGHSTNATTYARYDRPDASALVSALSVEKSVFIGWKTNSGTPRYLK